MSNTKVSQGQNQKPAGPTRSGVFDDFKQKEIRVEPLTAEWTVSGWFGRVNESWPRERAAELWLESEAKLMSERNAAHFRDFQPGADESSDWNT